MFSSPDTNSRSSRLWQSLLVLACLLVLTSVTGIIVACSSGSKVTTSGMAQVHVTLSDPATCAAPDGPYSAVWVTVTDVQANVSSSAGANDSGWVDLTPNLTKNNQAVQVNLLGEANNACFLADLGDNMELQAGSYQQIRIILASTTTGLTLTSGAGTDPAMSNTDQCSSTGAANCVVMTDSTNNTSQAYALQLSSEAKTGIKIPSGQIAGGAFTISAGQTEDLNIDFNTCSSIVQEGNGAFRLKPVLHAGEAGTTSVSMNGKVVDANGNPVAGAMVSLEQSEGATDANGNPIDRILMSTPTASDGTWVLCPVTVGDTTKPYDIVITGTDSNGLMMSPTILTGVSIGSTFGTVTLNAAASSLTTAANSMATLSGQITSVNSSSAGTPIDATLSVLETFSGVDYTVLLPTTTTPAQTSGSSATFTTAPYTSQNPACNPTSADCVNYSIAVPASSAYIGAWSTSGVTLTAPASPLATYMIDGQATVSGSTSSVDCSPSEMFSTATALTTTPLPPAATGVDLAFTGCQ